MLNAIKRLFGKGASHEEELLHLGFTKTSSGMVCGDTYDSPKRRFSAVLQRDSMYNGKPVPGGVWMFEGRVERLAVTDMKVPSRCAVSDTGRLIVADGINRNTLSSWIRIFERDGTLLYTAKHRRNVGGVGISSEGNIAVYGTANPNALMRVVEVETGRVIATVPGNGFFSDAVIDEALRLVHLDTKYPEQVRSVTYSATDGSIEEVE